MMWKSSGPFSFVAGGKMGVGGDGAAGAELPQRDPEACGSEAVMVGTASEAWGGGQGWGQGWQELGLCC